MTIPPRFDDDYQYFLEVTQTPERNQRQADLIASLLRLNPAQSVLDAPCGIGRIATKLAHKGLKVTGLDGSADYIDIARRRALEEGLVIDYRTGDLRALPWINTFDVALSWFISFGYFDDATDQAILAEYHAALKPGGRLLMDHVYLPGFLTSIRPDNRTSSTLTRDGNSMAITTEFDEKDRVNRVRRTVQRDGHTTTIDFSVRFYMPEELKEWLQRAGFGRITTFSKLGNPFIPDDAERYIILAEKNT